MVKEEVVWENYTLPNITLYGAKLPEEVVNRLWGYIDEAKNNKGDIQNLGDPRYNIDRAIDLKDRDDYFLDFLNPILMEYLGNEDNTYILDVLSPHKEQKLYLRSLWVNYQSKHEFLPNHFHLDSQISFVIWMKIPYEWEDQHSLPICKNSADPSAGDIEFTYSDILGNHHDYKFLMGSRLEGTIIIFPSLLLHQVYPFYNCDGKRISISGNISW